MKCADIVSKEIGHVPWMLHDDQLTIWFEKALKLGQKSSALRRIAYLMR